MLLADAPDHLVPSSARAQLAVDLDLLPYRSAWCQLEGMSGAPDAMAIPVTVHHDAWTAWVRHPGHGACLPYLLDEASVVVVESTPPAWPVVRPLDRLQRWQLTAAGVLSPPGWAEEVQAAWKRTADTAHHDLARRGGAEISGAMEPLHLGRLRRHFRTLLRWQEEGRVGGVRWSRSIVAPGTSRLVTWDEPVARFFHHELSGMASWVVGHPVKPTRCAVVIDVTETTSHHDPALEGVRSLDVDEPPEGFTLAVLVDAWPEPDRPATPPPPQLLTRDRYIHPAVLGDGLLVRGGVVCAHLGLTDRLLSTAILFGYVREG